MSSKVEAEFRGVPSVDRVISDERIKHLEDNYPRTAILRLIRQSLDEIRHSIAMGNRCPPGDEIVESICERAQHLREISLRPVINATGVILHTNLGRALLSQEAIEAMNLAAQGYTNLELDLLDGKRGSRDIHIEPLVCQLTGAEAAVVVNNNASAVLLALAALARRKEVIVSRGQAVQIGGGFRIPEVMQQSGTKLVEVGTTNCTYLADYEQTITPRTAALLRVHSSNFKVIGFTSGVAIEELVQLGRQHGLPVLDDLGSGCLIDSAQFGLEHEPMVQESVAAGVGLTFFSGDKLLGGPQAGLIVGRKAQIDKLKRHPLLRALRIDKIRLAGLAATLLHYLNGEAESKIPVWQMVSLPLENIRKRANEWARPLEGLATVAQGESVVGGGSLPGGTLPTWLVAIKMGQSRLLDLSQKLRSQQTPVIGRIDSNTLLLDPRTVRPEEDEALLRALRTALQIS